MNSRRLAAILVWVQAIALSVTGLVLVNIRTIEVASPIADEAGVFDITVVPVMNLGIALLSVGMLILAALLIIEANRKPVA